MIFLTVFFFSKKRYKYFCQKVQKFNLYLWIHVGKTCFEREVYFYCSVKPRNVEADAHTEGSLAAEISMVALDTLELIIQVRGQQRSKSIDLHHYAYS